MADTSSSVKWPLLNGKQEVVGFTQIDEEDLTTLGAIPWFLHTHGYAYRVKGNVSYMLHRVILGADSSLCVDHINGDRLDNRRDNLRLATKSQNAHNSLKTYGSSPRRGVSWLTRERRWRALITLNGKHILLGTYRNLADAIKAREEGERKYLGEFAPTRLNLRPA